MKHVQCPAAYIQKEKAIFLAGGISNCPLWQQELINLLSDSKVIVLNPRRKNFSLENPNIEEEQIEWEHNHLDKASAISFWFPCETVCPITLFELGKVSMTKKPIFVGVHPEYKRKRDVQIQLKLVRPEVNIVNSLEDLAKQIKDWDS